MYGDIAPKFEVKKTLLGFFFVKMPKICKNAKVS